MGFQVPRATIKIDFKEGASFGELSLISFGYGLHQAWIYSSMFDKGGIFGTGGLQAGPFNDQLSLAYFVSILIYGLLLLSCCLLGASPSRGATQPPSSLTERSPSPSDSASTASCCTRSPFRGAAWQAPLFPLRKSPFCLCCVAT